MPQVFEFVFVFVSVFLFVFVFVFLFVFVLVFVPVFLPFTKNMAGISWKEVGCEKCRLMPQVVPCPSASSGQVLQM